MTDQPHSRTPDETAVARAIGDFTEHQAGIPPRLKALAVNAVGPALQARGEWLRLTTRQAVAVAVLVAVKADLEAGTSGLPDVAGQCPACLRSGLFLGNGGYVTCPQTDCPAPAAADQLLHGHPQAAIEAKAADCAEAAVISRVAERRTTYEARAAGLREALQILGRTTPDNPAASSDGVDSSAAEALTTRVRAVLDDPNDFAWRQRIGVALQGEPCRATSHAPNAIGNERCALLAGHAGRHADGILTWPAHDGPSVAELAANDRNWDVEQGGE